MTTARLKALGLFHITTIFKRLVHASVFLLVSLFTYHCALSTTIASSGLISQVGGVTFIQGAKQFWVTSSKPTFSGVTTSQASVTGTVGSQSVSATADSSGNWSWTPSADLSGDNPVTITSGSTSVSFTLTIGNVPANIASASGGTLAPAGSINPTIAFLVIGAGLILIGTFGLTRSFSKPQQ